MPAVFCGLAALMLHALRVIVSGALTQGAPAVPLVRKTNRGYAWSGRAAAMPVPVALTGSSVVTGSRIPSPDREPSPISPKSHSRRSSSANSRNAWPGSSRQLIPG